jgi:hypothetical protein
VTLTLVRQRVELEARKAVGSPVHVANVQNIPQSVFNIGLQNVLTVTRDRVFFNTAEVRSNVWMTRIE